ncbi:helix-turn-helix domain-containing protein [Streptomyces sp. NPDC085927]|uniref:helix-turn-helix domain-containing protein n=1 Tax=Streptomyces sp. NPDC085927 TaxID=3365738 RepID=UPI0037CD4B5E
MGAPVPGHPRRRRLHVDTMRAWRGRCATGGLPALAGRKRSGRPASFTILQVAEVEAPACQLPAETGTPLSRWSCSEPAREVVGRSIAGSVSPSTVRRRLKQDALKPWQYQSWVFVCDPAFQPKAARVLGLYARTVHGAPPGKNEYVISADEKASLRAHCRCGPRTGTAPFMNLGTQVHDLRGKKPTDRPNRAFPNAAMVHSPVHASWTNQIELFFSIVQRKVVPPNDFLAQ